VISNHYAGILFSLKDNVREIVFRNIGIFSVLILKKNKCSSCFITLNNLILFTN